MPPAKSSCGLAGPAILYVQGCTPAGCLRQTRMDRLTPAQLPAGPALPATGQCPPETEQARPAFEQAGLAAARDDVTGP